jgi:hypothetical protein
MKKFLAALALRFSQPSSYAGLAALFALLGWQLSDTTLGALVQVLAGGAGLVAIWLNEKGGAIKVLLPVAAVIVAGVALSACTTAQLDATQARVDAGRARVATVAQQIQPSLITACSLAMQFAPAAGPYAPFIIAGCGTAEAIDKLAADPSSTDWVNGLIADARRVSSAVRR